LYRLGISYKARLPWTLTRQRYMMGRNSAGLGKRRRPQEREEAMNLATKVESKIENRDQALRERAKKVIPGGM